MALQINFSDEQYFSSGYESNDFMPDTFSLPMGGHKLPFKGDGGPVQVVDLGGVDCGDVFDDDNFNDLFLVASGGWGLDWHEGFDFEQES